MILRSEVPGLPVVGKSLTYRVVCSLTSIHLLKKKDLISWEHFRYQWYPYPDSSKLMTCSNKRLSITHLWDQSCYNFNLLKLNLSKLPQDFLRHCQRGIKGVSRLLPRYGQFIL